MWVKRVQGMLVGQFLVRICHTFLQVPLSITKTKLAQGPIKLTPAPFVRPVKEGRKTKEKLAKARTPVHAIVCPGRAKPARQSAWSIPRISLNPTPTCVHSHGMRFLVECQSRWRSLLWYVTLL